MNTPPPIYVGPSSPARCAQAAEAVAAAKTNKDTLKEIAVDLGVSRGTLRRMVEAHKAMREYQVKLARDGAAPMAVCHVITPKGAMAAAVAAFREYPGTLKGLELPGWYLLVGDQRFQLHAVRDEAAPQRRAA
ncbi:hypothetical protein [Rhodanobacter glycinis]|uniref:hypothetical protein n=1 Tax=Rhodanobacter glycinis TaxID=582702 RepID=UPI0013762583|nr:hypothetical protein [Rhodanobacter glycinis]